ncbi:hypothetical protein MMC20_002202 [Loxospora ochrophaea]|nr:hypothetical protein [Loxospora ochrophaea]
MSTNSLKNLQKRRRFEQGERKDFLEALPPHLRTQYVENKAEKGSKEHKLLRAMRQWVCEVVEENKALKEALVARGGGEAVVKMEEDEEEAEKVKKEEEEEEEEQEWEEWEGSVGEEETEEGGETEEEEETEKGGETGDEETEKGEGETEDEEMGEGDEDDDDDDDDEGVELESEIDPAWKEEGWTKTGSSRYGDPYRDTTEETEGRGPYRDITEETESRDGGEDEDEDEDMLDG